MSRYVLDAPTLLYLVLNDVPINLDHQLIAPSSIRTHSLDLLFQLVRGGELTEADALVYHTRLSKLKIRLLGDHVLRRNAWKIAREQGWDSIYAAEIIAAARLQADGLITLDKKLARQAAGLVGIAPVSVLINIQHSCNSAN